MQFDPVYSWCAGKVLSKEEAKQKADELRTQGKKIVTVNGSFDLLHPGHLILLSEAKKQGDVLFVGINTDCSVKQYKGESRPIIPEDERIAMLGGLAAVDFIVPIPESEAGREILLTVHPNVHVNGSEYGEPETWVEWPAISEVGATPYKVTRQPNLATTDIIKKIKEL